MPDEDFASLSPQEQLELQKASCVFCKIIKGEIPSKEVYADDTVLAILDINPAAKGHTLVMPKEHFPILPLVPPPVFAALFKAARAIAQGVKAGAVTDKATVFIANGGAAGQQSPHFLFHIVPREAGDGLDNFAVPRKEVPREKILEALPGIKQRLAAHLRATGRPSTAPPLGAAAQAPSLPTALPPRAAPPSMPTPPPEVPLQPGPEFSGDQLAEVLDANDDLRRLLIDKPGLVVEQLRTNAALRALFAGINIHALSDKLRELEKTRDKAAPTPPSAHPPPPKPAGHADLDTVSRLFT